MKTTPTSIRRHFGLRRWCAGLAALFLAVAGLNAQRVTDGLVVRYAFAEGGGTTVHDVSGSGAPLDLHIADPGNVTWLPGGGLRIDAGTIIASGGAGTKVYNGLTASHAYTIEAFVQSANDGQSGPARIVTLSQDPYQRNLTLGQEYDDYISRTRSNGNDNGTPNLWSGSRVDASRIQHVVVTRGTDDVEKLYVDGVLVCSHTRSGDFSGWNAGYRLALANEITEDRDWLGTLHDVAIYDRPLSLSEIAQNAAAFYGGTTDCSTDTEAPQFSGVPADASATVCGGLPSVPAVCSNVVSVYAQYVKYSNGVKDAHLALGAPDGHVAEFYDNGDKFELEFDRVLAAGTEVCVTWKRRNYTATTPDPINAVAEIWEITPSGAYHQTATLTTSESTTFVTQCFTLTHDAAYVKIRNTGSASDFEVDAVSYRSLACEPGSIVVTDDCDTAPSVSFTETTGSCAGGSYTVTRTWTATDAAGNMASASQVITVTDNDPPVLSGAPADLSVSCGAVPAADTLTAVDGCGDGGTACAVLGYDNGSYRRSLYLPGTGLDVNHEWVGGSGQFEAFADGTARLTGQVINRQDPSCGWDVDVWFTGAYDWAAWSALGRTYKPGPGTTGTVYEDWTYYEVDGSRSTLTGTGCWSGDVLHLTNKPADFSMGLQIGVGANDKDATYGMSFWFFYTGTLNGASASGNGDFNLEGGCVAPAGEGLHYAYWESATNIHSLADFFGGAGPGAPTATGTTPNAQDADHLAIAQVHEKYAIRWTGAIDVPSTGSYTFYTNSDDGSRLYIDGALVVDNDGLHAVREEQGTVYLTAGCHDLVIEFFENTGGNVMQTSWEGPGISKQPIPDAVLRGDCSATVSGVAVPVSFTETVGACSGGSYTITRTWTATDACGNTASHTQTITVTDNDAPALVGLPDDVNLGCGDPVPPVPTVSATDDCDDAPVVTFSEVHLSLSIERTWTATDACGNSSSHTQTITLDPDVTAPVLVGVPADATVSCDAIPAAAVVTANDDCDGAVSVTFSETYGPGPVSCRTVTRTWTATDAAGNTASASQILFVQDNLPPVLVGVPMDLTVSCNEPVPAPATVTAMDNCDASVSVSFSETTVGGILTRTWTATDACGNMASASQQITLAPDVSAPVLVGVPADATVSCDAIPAVAVVTANDDCDGAVSVTFSETYGPGPVSCRTVTRTWTATDAAGNTASASQLITVQDNLPPVLLGTHPDATVQCGHVPAPADVTAVDDCDTSVAVVFSEVQIGSGCSYTIERTWTATDDCGNTASYTQVLTVIDNVAPWFAGQPGNRVIRCDEPVPPVSAFIRAEDDCDGPIPLVFSENVEPSTIGCYDIVRRWVATDACGNSKTWTQYISVIDTVAPVLDGVPADLTLACGEAVPAPAVVTATDDCDTAAIAVVYHETMNADAIVRTWTATDACGNAVSASQTITLGTELAIVSVTVTDASGCRAKDGTLTIDLDDASAGTAPYTVTVNGSFTFGPFAAEPIVIGNVPGGVTITAITVDDAGGCQATDNGSYPVGEPSLTIAGLVTADADCVSGQGSVTIDLDDADAGMAPYWVKIGGDVYGPFASEPITVAVAPGTYNKVAVRDAKGCTEQRNVTVAIAPPTGCGACPAPTGGGSIVNGRHTADVFWNAVLEGTGSYLVEIRELGATAFTVIPVSDTIKRVGGLEPCTTYEWCVRTICGFDTSDCSGLQTFTTDCARTVGGDFVNARLFPNPTASTVYLHIEVSEPADILLEVFDATGRRIHAESAGTTYAHQASLEMTGQAPGVYVAKWTVDGEPVLERFVYTAE